MAEKIKITFLGTGGAVPTSKRNHTAVLLKHGGENILVDCGEGTQRQFRKAKLNPCKINRILITHWHGDHVLGLPGLFQTLVFSGYKKKLKIYGPVGTKKFVQRLLNTFLFYGKIGLEVKEISKAGIFINEKDFFIEAKKLIHGANCLGYNFIKKGKTRIDKKKLAKLKIPAGKHLQKLKQGKNISYKGKKYFAKNLTYREKDKKISFIWDTFYDKRISKFVRDSDLLITESTLGEDLKQFAKEAKHLTADQAAKIAKEAKAKKLILIHTSQRYTKESEKILKQAKKVFKNSYLPKDLDSVEI